MTNRKTEGCEGQLKTFRKMLKGFKLRSKEICHTPLILNSPLPTNHNVRKGLKLNIIIY